MITKFLSWLFGTCYHSFSKWETKNRFINQEWGLVREVQERTCSKCGLKQLRQEDN
jgi:hypothetical protein